MARRVANLVVALAAAAAAKCEVLRSLEFQDADLLAEIERLRERATTYGLVAAVAVALALITVIVASNAQTASAATARASLTPPRPAPKVVSYPFLAPEQVEKAPYRSPFDSPTI